jgi:Spy/CpxP family protein refolding chaperone
MSEPGGSGDRAAAALANLVAATRIYVAQVEKERDQAVVHSMQLRHELDQADALTAEQRAQIGRLVERVTELTYVEAAYEEHIALSVWDLVDGRWES